QGVAAAATAAFLLTTMVVPARAMAWFGSDLSASVAARRRAAPRAEPAATAADGSATLTAERGPGALRFAGVGLTVAGRTLLSAVSFVVPPGQVVAVAGANVAAISAVGALAARLVHPTNGTVTADGVDVRELADESLATHVTWLPAGRDTIAAAVRS